MTDKEALAETKRLFGSMAWIKRNSEAMVQAGSLHPEDDQYKRFYVSSAYMDSREGGSNESWEAALEKAVANHRRIYPWVPIDDPNHVKQRASRTKEDIRGQ